MGDNLVQAGDAEPSKAEDHGGTGAVGVEHKISGTTFEVYKGTLLLFELILDQKRKTKNKIYSLHVSELECATKGRPTGPTTIRLKRRMEDRTESA